MQHCYMCGESATTREHVPPKCFFPKPHRRDLFTVPSCEAHNLDNSKDVEYVRNFIVSLSQTNELAEELFETAKRSYERSPALAHQTFRGFRTVEQNGEEVAAVRMDTSRLAEVMKAIASALYFKDNNGDVYAAGWNVFSPTMKSEAVLFNNEEDEWARIRELLSRAPYRDLPVPQSRIFQYAVSLFMDRGFAFRFVFYESFEVNVWTNLEAT